MLHYRLERLPNLNIPELTYNNIYVELGPKAKFYYKKMEKEFFIELDEGEASAEAAAQASMKCQQIANGKVYEDIPEGLTEDEVKAFRRTRRTLHVHDKKLEALSDLISELNGKPLLIAYYFRHDLEALRGLLGANIPYIGSGVSPARAKQLEADWNAGSLPVLLAQPTSVAYGLNFRFGGHDICWYSLIWSAGDYIQFNERIHRQGVKNSVRVHHLIAKGTVDEAMLFRLGVRAKEQHSLREALRYYRSGLSKDLDD